MPVSQNPGLQPSVQQGIQGGPVPLLGQTSPGAPMQNQAPQAMNPSDAQSVQGPDQQPQGGLTPTTESEMIIKALADRLKMNSKAQSQQMQNSPQPAMGMGGGNYSYSAGGGMNYGYGGGASSRVGNFSHSEPSPVPKMYQNRMY